VVALIIVGSLRIAGTYTVFNHTPDEPEHTACGIDWLQKGVAYEDGFEHPPLARIAAGIGPYLVGRRLVEKAYDSTGALVTPTMRQQGELVLYMDQHYDRNLALARLGILPFYWIASAVVFLWARRSFGNLTAIAATFLFTFLPPILTHAGLATTDMALAAMAGASFLAGIEWLDRPDLKRSLIFGLFSGLAVLSKFSSLVFLPAAFGAALIWRIASAPSELRNAAGFARRRLLPFVIAVAMGALIVWACYRFSFGKVWFANLSLQAPGLLAGIRHVMQHNTAGHSSYLLGMRNKHGFWYYYPVVLAVKTPLPFLALLIAGVATALRKANWPRAEHWLPLAFSFGILGLALFSNINIGVRHVLPLYIGFSITAAAGAARLWQSARETRWLGYLAAVLLVGHAASSALCHPDYLAYTNALAGPDPEKVLVDSDLDWGQDMKRVGQRLRELRATQVTFNPEVAGYWEQAHGFPPILPMDPQTPGPGWNAASVTVMLSDRLGLGDDQPNVRLWTEGVKPTEKVGKSTYLWYVPPR